ncbi:MAG: cytochrome ubiquinol oxidase subunit I [Desulfovibrionales bacterium]|nr:cytochrome ubiquinol oxidase subunit I [Desulfovibrionales bacterium]
MEYPVWWLPAFSGGFLIATMAIFHVFIAHLAVGGGFFLVLTERKGYAEKNPAIIGYVRTHTKFFLLLTMVAGGMTGVGIWFTIGLLSPAATSLLVHTFGFAWATEWVFFLGEIVALLIYHYRFGKMSQRDHQIIGWLYALFAFLSLFVINGIITMMLTPGNWLETRSFWDGFWNPTFWPSLCFRFALCLMLAGLFALVTAYRINDIPTREKMIRYAVRFVAIPFFFLALSAVWYLYSLPEEQFSMIVTKSAQTPTLVHLFLPISIALVLGALAFAYVTPQSVRPALLGVLLITGLGQIGTFEWIREAGRRPYLIHGYMWSNSIRTADTAKLQKEGMLGNAKWISTPTVTAETMIAAGNELYRVQCMACHSLNGPMLASADIASGFTRHGLRTQLNGQGKLREFMPPFLGTAQEQDAISAYLAHAMGKPLTLPDAPTPERATIKLPDYDNTQSKFILAAWATEGMTTISDNYNAFTMQLPGSTVRAQLFLRGDVPEVVTEDVVLIYKIAPEFSTPSEHVTFWNHAPQLIGKQLPPDTGITNKNLIGTFTLHADQGFFEAQDLPIFPYSNTGNVNPYPLLTIEARDTNAHLLASTRVAVPVSTEWGCRNCHEGGWRKRGIAGLSDKTAETILAAHDKINNTSLLQRVEHNRPVRCQSCHSDPRTNDAGKKELISFSAAIHGWHANYMAENDATACESCHPASPHTTTQAMRGLHVDRSVTCIECHGTLVEHALSLLKKDKELGKNNIDRLMTGLAPQPVISTITPRNAWQNQPDCTACHSYFETPASDASAVNNWTENSASLFKNRKDDMDAVMCQACHGTTHALYPAENNYGDTQNNITPLQYMDTAAPLGAADGCVCHTSEMSMYDSAHHPIIEK